MLIVIDVETTDPENAHPIEIAAAVLPHLDVTFKERIRPSPGVKISPKATKFHHIKISDLELYRSEKEVMTAFIAFLKDKGAPTIASGGTLQLVAHIATFDRRVIDSALERCGLTSEMPSHTWLCTMLLSRATYAVHGTRHHTLEWCCVRAGIPYTNAHAALAEAKMCGKVYLALMEVNGDSATAAAAAATLMEKTGVSASGSAAAPLAPAAQGKKVGVAARAAATPAGGGGAKVGAAARAAAAPTGSGGATGGGPGSGPIRGGPVLGVVGRLAGGPEAATSPLAPGALVSTASAADAAVAVIDVPSLAARLDRLELRLQNERAAREKLGQELQQLKLALSSHA
jgi:DNA polymerase III epsilon subunit-like protein